MYIVSCCFLGFFFFSLYYLLKTNNFKAKDKLISIKQEPWHKSITIEIVQVGNEYYLVKKEDGSVVPEPKFFINKRFKKQ